MDAQLLKQYCDEFALGLLEGQERAELQTLLDSGDAAAKAQIRESEEFVAQLALAAPPVAPPALVRSQVMNLVREERQQSPSAAVTRPPRSWTLGWAVAAALLVASLYSYFAQWALRRELDAVQTRLTAARSEADRSRKVLAVVLSRDARFIKMSTDAQQPLFRAFWGGSAGLVLAGSNIPALAQGRTLQLWVVPKSGQPISAGVFTPGPDGQVLMIAETAAQIGNAAALAISDEPAGGSPQPTTKPAFVGTVGD